MMGYDSMAAWDRSSFEFNDHIQQRGGEWENRIPWSSARGETIVRTDYQPPSPVTLPIRPSAAPSFESTTAKWSPPTSPGAWSASSSTPTSPTQSSGVDSACDLQSPLVTKLDVRERRLLAEKLYNASCSGDLDDLRLLINLGAPVNSNTLVQGLYEAFKPAKAGHLSPLAGAATHSQLDAVELLLANGACLNPDVNQSSSSPLHQACRANDVEIAHCLLELGADVNMLNCYKTTPLMYAAKYGSVELVQTVLAYNPDLDQLSFIQSAAIHWAIWPGKVDKVELLLKAGANVDHPMGDGSTPLHCAAISGHVEVAQCLLRYGANPQKRNQDWKTPAEVAAENRHGEVAALLQDSSPKPLKRRK